MAYPVPGTREPFLATRRQDTWWVVPLVMATAFIAFIAYASWAAFQPVEYSRFGPYISPFFSPDLTRFVPGLGWSPALLILWIPAGFRLTCYYGRKAYYRSLTMSPPACAVGKGQRDYKGERALPWVLNNIHRYFLYLVTIFVIFHWIHLLDAFRFDDGIGMGLGTLVVSADTVFLSLYVFSCHSLRHMVGGKIDCYSCAAAGVTRHKLWTGISILNDRHNVYFWCSLFTVGFADVYVRMCAMGVWHDVRFF
ncbi:MAG: succinate dehydrogenase [bacterium]|nr:succinate dehydrogenase [bacterium]